MATGAQLIDAVAGLARVSSTSSTERALVLSFVQQAADRTALDAEVNNPAEISAALTAGTDTYTLGSSPFTFSSGLIAVNRIRLTDAAQTKVPLTQKTMQAVNELRQGAVANATPAYYAVEYPTIVFYPPPAAGTTVYVDYVADGPTIADSATEITAIPKGLQWKCWFNFAMYMTFEYKQDATANDWLAKYNDGLRELRRWANRVGGLDRPSTAASYTAPDPRVDTGMFS